ncbi:MAG: hypothetical protein EOM20_21705, partial [Spartobacteria bacterium]|nr:hypothetical protein [Spartobacteria bacterium]
GGSFTTAGTCSAVRVAMWNGETWTNLGSGVSSTVRALVVDTNGCLYAGGYFTTAGGVLARYVAKWDGEVWSPMGEGFSDYVLDLGFDEEGTLYACGEFFKSGSQDALCIAKWNGAAWTNMGNGLYHPSSTPNCYSVVALSNDGIYAGGQFLNSGTNACAYMAKWAPDSVTVFPGVYPSNGPVSGGHLVTISGANLCDGADVTNVTLCGAPVNGIISQCDTQLVVETGPSTPALGDVTVYSTSFGNTEKADAYRYQNASQIYLHDLTQVFDGTAKWVTATTDPGGLTVSLTYEGAAMPPADAGVYTVTAVVENVDYYGWTTDTLVIQKATQGLSFSGPGDQVVTSTVPLSATADSGFPIAFSVDSGPAVLSAVTNLSFTQRGYVQVVALQEGNENWQPAAHVTNRFRVYGIFTV